MRRWKKVGRDKVVYNGWRKVISKKFITPAGKVDEFEDWGGDKNKFCSIVLALTKDYKVIVARQFRFGPEEYLDELPGGGAEKYESPQKCATRELVEETGYLFDSIEKLGSVYKDANFNFKHHYYLAKGCVKRTSQHTDENEFIEVKLITIDELIKNAKTGKMTDPAAVLMAYDELIKIKEYQGK